MTVCEYDLANWMGLDGQVKGINTTSLLGINQTHTSSVMVNTIVWSHVWPFVTPTLVFAGNYGSMIHMGKWATTFSDLLDLPGVRKVARDPSPYWQWDVYGTAVATIRAQADQFGTNKGAGAGGAYSGSIPVIVDGNCYWVEIGAGSQMPSIVRQALIDAGFAIV